MTSALTRSYKLGNAYDCGKNEAVPAVAVIAIPLGSGRRSPLALCNTMDHESRCSYDCPRDSGFKKTGQKSSFKLKR
jgi:hypothetical protein